MNGYIYGFFGKLNGDYRIFIIRKGEFLYFVFDLFSELNILEI